MPAVDFKTSVLDLVGDFSDDNALNDFLTASAREVIAILPPPVLLQNSSSENWIVSTGFHSVDNKKILEVIRQGYACKQIPQGKATEAADTNSIFLASARDPVFYLKAGRAYILPTPTGSDGDSVLILMPQPSVITTATAIANFPDNAEYAVVLGASAKALQRMASDVRDEVNKTNGDIAQFNTFVTTDEEFELGSVQSQLLQTQIQRFQGYMGQHKTLFELYQAELQRLSQTQ
jgi:hypothetical protein